MSKACLMVYFWQVIQFILNLYPNPNPNPNYKCGVSLQFRRPSAHFQMPTAWSWCCTKSGGRAGRCFWDNSLVQNWAKAMANGRNWGHTKKQETQMSQNNVEWLLNTGSTTDLHQLLCLPLWRGTGKAYPPKNKTLSSSRTKTRKYQANLRINNQWNIFLPWNQKPEMFLFYLRKSWFV